MFSRIHLSSPFSRAITPKTKMIIVNTPHNPIGKVFTRAELVGIAELACEHNLLVLADEVVCSCHFSRVNFCDVGSCSMTVWSLTKKLMFVSPLYQECGKEQLPWVQQEVSNQS